MPLVRRMVNRYMSGKISRVCGQEIPDTQCGFRMLHRDIIPDVLDGASRFDYETEMLIIASRKGYRIASVPITTIYSDEVSSIHPVRDTLRFFKLMRRYRKAVAAAVSAAHFGRARLHNHRVSQDSFAFPCSVIPSASEGPRQ